ncbi:MAG: pyridoxamine 5'-phosphate oxidase family protein [Thalassobaculaceae bacterium]|nr:pyridoxamine 5'-phosphate oxidase family protein [Thalassobaculaceae bacterium]
MTALPPDDLETLAAHIADRLTTASDTRRGAWRTPVLATASANGPRARVVVIRSVDVAARRIEIFTDAGSHKVDEIAADPRVALTFWDPDTGEQLRVAARAYAVADPTLVDARWSDIGSAGQALYGDGPAIDRRARFVVLQAVWNAWDWLWIADTPHRRATLTWTDDGRRETSWIDP